MKFTTSLAAALTLAATGTSAQAQPRITLRQNDVVAVDAILECEQTISFAECIDLAKRESTQNNLKLVAIYTREGGKQIFTFVDKDKTTELAEGTMLVPNAPATPKPSPAPSI
jgi:hypothetical protein